MNTRQFAEKVAEQGLEVVAVEGIDHGDAPDYCDAFVSDAHWKKSLETLTEEEFEVLNDDFRDLTFDAIQEHAASHGAAAADAAYDAWKEGG